MTPHDSPSRCVVCAASVANPSWPSAWERRLALRACCSDACARRFDPDRHWMPSRALAPAAEEEATALLVAAAERLRAGDHARPVARDLLLAGVAPWRVRNAVLAVAAGARAERRDAWFLPLATLGGWFVGTRSGYDAGSEGGVLDDLDAWIAAFGE